MTANLRETDGKPALSSPHEVPLLLDSVEPSLGMMRKSCGSVCIDHLCKAMHRGALAAALCVLVAGCGGGDASDTSKPPSEPQVTPAALDYSFVVNCPNYFTATNTPSWANSHGNFANRLQVDITDRAGKVLKNVASRKETFGQVEFKSSDVKALVESGKGQYLNITCGYSQGEKSQYFSYRRAIDDRSLWRVNSRTSESDAYFEVSMLADLQRRLWELLMARGRAEADAWNESLRIIDANFGQVRYGAMLDETLHANGAGAIVEHNALVAESSANGRAFRRLKLIAELHTGEPTGNVQQVLSSAAADYIRKSIDGQACLQPDVCGAVFMALTKATSPAPTSFANPAWREYRSPDANFSSVSQDNLDGSWTAGLAWKSGRTNSEFIVQRQQTVLLNAGEDYRQLFLNIDLASAVGGCSASIFGCTVASGISGVFVCFDDSSDQRLGCVLFGAISDAIIISNLLGNSFSAGTPLKSSSVRGIPLSPSSPNSPAYGLSRIYSISDVLSLHGGASVLAAGRAGTIRSVTFGAAVLASSGDCYQCKADLTILSLGLRKL